MAGFNENWSYPEGHPISRERAEALLRGGLGAYYLTIIQQSCAPIYWYRSVAGGRGSIIANGTITFVRTPSRLFGVTANHVIQDYEALIGSEGLVAQIFQARYEPKIISRSERLDLITLDIPEQILSELGKKIVPLSLPRPHDAPQEGRGILLGGYVGQERREVSPSIVEWGMLGAVGVARRVSEKQITWSPDREHHIDVLGLPPLPPHKDLGGISGGPLIALFEKANGQLAYHSLGGVIVEANPQIENVVAIRSEFIREDGTLRHC
jgi:hypothetical protein